MTIMEQSKTVMDGLSISTMIAALVGWLPAVAAFLTIIWTAIRIWETKTVQKLLERFKNND